MANNFNYKRTQDAVDTPFDNSVNGFISEDVQAAIEEVDDKIKVSASPGFSFGREGSSGNGTWLRRVGNIESNRTGVSIPVINPVITSISCGTENIATYSVTVYEHDGNSINLTVLTTVSISAARFQTFSVNVPATQGRQLAVRCTATSMGNPNNLGVDIVIQGQT